MWRLLDYLMENKWQSKKEEKSYRIVGASNISLSANAYQRQHNISIPYARPHEPVLCSHLEVLTWLKYLILHPLTWKIWWIPNNASRWQMGFNSGFNPLNAELNPICFLLVLLGTHHIFHVSGLRVRGLITKILKSFCDMSLFYVTII